MEEMSEDIKYIKKNEMDELKKFRETLKNLEMIPKRIMDVEEDVSGLIEEEEKCHSETEELRGRMDTREQYNRKNNLII